MATTTNYSWTTPDDTSLVKDGAAAIRTLGSSIDTTTKNLNPQTTTGAIAYRSATSNVNTALPIGTAGQVLTVNSGATAPEWATPAAGGMTLIANTTLGTTATSITFSTISGSFKDLMILFTGRNDSVGGNGTRLRITFNADTGNNYFTVGGGRTGSSGETLNLAIEGNGIAYVDFANYIANSAAATQYTSAVQMIIPRYSGATLRKAISANGSNVVDASNISAKVLTGYWNNTAAITDITITASAGNFIAGTSASLYGLG